MRTAASTFPLILALFVLVSLTSCSKNDDPPPPPTTAELLAHKWFFVKQVSGQPPITHLADDCEATGYFNFYTGGDLVVQTYNFDSNNDCIANTAQSFTYTLTADEKQIVVSGGSIPAVWNILILTETQLEIEVDFGIITLKREP